MCKQVFVDGECCQTHGELAKQIGGAPLYHPAVQDITDEDCLCGLDIEATATQFGLVVEESNGCEAILRKSASLESQKPPEGGL